MIKNRYTLFLMLELINRFKRKKYYIKLDFWEIYNFIYIKKKEKWKIIFRIKYRYYKYIIILFKLINISAII